MIRILIVDDHAVVGGGLKQFLADVGDFEVAGEARTGQEALEKARTDQWDLVLLDIGLPDISGLEVLRRIKLEKPALPVLIFSMYPEDECAIAALEAGAVGYLPKDSMPEEILIAIRRASVGERYLSPELSEWLLKNSVGIGQKMPHERLSVREYEVMLLLSRGVPLTEIGERLHLSPKTITTYRARVLEKLGLKNNTEVTRYVLKHKIDHSSSDR